MSIVRRNMLSVNRYTPYCGDNNCSKGMPRTKYDKDKKQFICSCGWQSEFDNDFMDAYELFNSK